jgi:hypothetical protein
MERSIIRKVSFLAVFCLLLSNSCRQKISSLVASFEIELSNATYGMNIPVSVNLDNVTYVSDTLLSLYEVKGNTRTAIPFQIEQGDPRKLHWIVKTEAESTNKHLFELVKGKANQFPVVMATVNDGALIIHKGEQSLLQY